MSNKHRGEVPITLKSKEWTMRPTFDALVEFEEMANISVVETLMLWTRKQVDAKGRPMWSGDVRLKVLAAAIYTGIKGNAEARNLSEYPTMEAIGEAIMQVGPQKLFGDVFLYLSGSIAGEQDVAERLEDEGKEQGAA